MLAFGSAVVGLAALGLAVVGLATRLDLVVLASGAGLVAAASRDARAAGAVSAGFRSVAVSARAAGRPAPGFVAEGFVFVARFASVARRGSRGDLAPDLAPLAIVCVTP